MNTRAFLLIRAVRGPVVLITVGGLFALQQSGILPFSETWPLILIVLGVLKLLERLVVPPMPRPGPGAWPPPPPPPPPPGVRR